MRLSVGIRLGPYEILSLLGAGGMGEVYRARDVRLGREVAIKTLPSDLAHNRELRAMPWLACLSDRASVASMGNSYVEGSLAEGDRHVLPHRIQELHKPVVVVSHPRALGVVGQGIAKEGFCPQVAPFRQIVHNRHNGRVRVASGVPKVLGLLADSIERCRSFCFPISIENSARCVRPHVLGQVPVGVRRRVIDGAKKLEGADRINQRESGHCILFMGHTIPVQRKLKC